VSQSAVAPLQPVSTALPTASSTQRTHAGSVAAPSQTPPVQAVPAVSDVVTQAPAVQAFVVQALPSSQSASEAHATHTGLAPEVSQIAFAPVQPVSRPLPSVSSMQATHAGSLLAPSQTPPVHEVPSASEVAPHTPAVQVSVVQALPSLQSAAVVQPTQTGVAPEVSQVEVAPPQPVSVRPVGASSTHRTQTGSAPEVSQSAAAPPQPLSVAVPAASSMHVMQSGAIDEPLHTPPVHVLPAAREVAPHTPAVQVSVVQALPSLQSEAPKHCTHAGVAPEVLQNGALTPQPLSRPSAESSVHATQTGAAPEASQNGVASPQPLSVSAPVRSFTQVMQSGALGAPLQTPPVQLVPAVSEVRSQVPLTHASLVHALPSLQSEAPKHATHTGTAPEVSQSGVLDVQPVSVASPEALSTQGTHAGEVALPLHTPPVQLVPAVVAVR
jgi:hypothetical protein